MTQTSSYDVAVIGGGIAGAAIAGEAASRGLQVLLLEKNEFGFKESWKNFSFVFSSIRESQILRKTHPDLIEPHPILLPIYRSSPRRRWLIFLGTALYGIMAFGAGNRRFPRFLLSPEKVLRQTPSLRKEGLLGGVVLWENLTDDRALVNRIIQSAVEKGATALSHALVLHYCYDNAGKVYRIRTTTEGTEKVFEARQLVNATGPWVDQTRRRVSQARDAFVLPIAGAHIELKQFTPYSCLLQAEDHRFFFVINIHGVSRVGTTEREWADPDHVEPTDEEITYLINSLKYYFPSIAFSTNQIIRSDAGVRPLARPAKQSKANQVSREHAIFQTGDGVYHVVGVKLTDHRRAAIEVVNSTERK